MSTGDNTADLVRFLSIERLATFERITGSITGAISLHQQTLRLGSQIMLVTAVIEVALRNAVYENIESFFQKPDWLVNPPRSLEWENSEKSKITKAVKDSRRAIYAKMSQIEKKKSGYSCIPKRRDSLNL